MPNPTGIDFSEWWVNRKFKRWARGRTQLEILRTGWPQAGPYFVCNDPTCPGRDPGEMDDDGLAFPDHCYAVIETTDDDGAHTALHVHLYADVEANTMHVLTIESIGADGQRIERA